jgi:lysozyme family protein
MAFTDQLELQLSLEGDESNDPADPGGATKHGMTQLTYVRLGFAGPVLQASDTMIDLAYLRLAQTDLAYCAQLPEPADAVAFQMACNLGAGGGHHLLMSILGTTPNAWNGRGIELGRAIVAAQRAHYEAYAQPRFKNGLLNRCAKVDEWLTKKAAAGTDDLAASRHAEIIARLDQIIARLGKPA